MFFVSGCLPNSTTYNVNPSLWVLTAAEEFIANNCLDKTGEVVSMLEYLHQHHPGVGEERDYIDLLVDLKMKVSRVL